MSTNSFIYDLKSFNVAKTSTSRFHKEKDVLDYLVESQPPFLHVRDSWLGLDKQTLEKEVKGLSDKLTIHGYSDRGERLQYLHFALTKKLEGKDDLLKTVMKFLLEMSERPTAVGRFDLGTETYSLHPDEDMSEDEDSEKQKKLLRQILYDEEEIDQDTISYSSDSELSDWSSDDEDDSEKSKKSTNEIVEPDRNLKPSRSFSEFSDIPLAKDCEEKKKEMELYWRMEGIRAQQFFSDLRTVKIVLLQGQPVISGLLTLQSQFGKHWEWKKRSRNNLIKNVQILFEGDVILEIIRQFSALNPKTSPVFTDDWKVKPDLMVATLSVSSFKTLMKDYESIFTSLSKFKTFVNIVGDRSATNESLPPKMFLTYAQGLAEIILRIQSDVGTIEINLKNVNNNNHFTKRPQPCSTLIQLGKQLQHFKEIVSMIDRIHTLSFSLSEELDSVASNQWFCSIRLIYCLAMHLSLELKPSQFGILLFLFCKCLHSFLDEINLAMNTLIWNEDQFLFFRDRAIKLSDSNFWTDSISIRPYEEKLEQIGLPAIKSFTKLIHDVLIVFKTSEMLNQLEENFKKILGEPPCARTIVEEFVNKLLPKWNVKEDKVFEDPLPDYKTHFKFIGLESSSVTASMNYILDRQMTKSASQSRLTTKLDRFLQLSEVPTENIWEILDSALLGSYTPHCERAKNCIHKIFEDHQVDESMKTFREILLTVREDFAKAIVDLSSNSGVSERYRYEDEMNRNPRFQKILNDCYPEGRDNFDIEFKLDHSTRDMNYTFVVKPYFPLNLILTAESVQGYLFISRQLHRIRKSLWELTSLNIKECKVREGVEPNRFLLFRFALIHFCSNIRAYILFKIFAKDFSATTSQSYDLDDIRKVHADHLHELETKFLRSQVMEHIIIRKMVSMSEAVKKYWISGVSSKTMVLLEDTLKKCWDVVKTFHQSNYSYDYNELSYHFGPAPSYLKEA